MAKKEVIGFRLEKEFKEILERYANYRGLTLSQLMRAYAIALAEEIETGSIKLPKEIKKRLREELVMAKLEYYRRMIERYLEHIKTYIKACTRPGDAPRTKAYEKRAGREAMLAEKGLLDEKALYALYVKLFEYKEAYEQLAKQLADEETINKTRAKIEEIVRTLKWLHYETKPYY